MQAARLLAQATFGATREDLRQVKALGAERWIDNQFTLSGESHYDYVRRYSNNSNRFARHEAWWNGAIDGDDQLRQRVAFALSQLLVVSDTGYTLSNAQWGVASYYQLLIDNAFGNYRDLLEKVTLHPVMGVYLSMLQNSKGDVDSGTRPDENFAREVLQLFSIGLYELNLDGSTDGRSSFTQAQVEAFARVFTGWNFADAGQRWASVLNGADLENPMLPFEDFHDTGSKTLLNGEQLAANLSAREDLEQALDNIFAHPNVGPFVSKHLIKRLVTSNPSPRYIRDVATVFNNDGTRTRGNLKAVVKAVLMHDEARTISNADTYGKLREPMLRVSHLWRAFGVLPGSGSSTTRNEYNTNAPELKDFELAFGQAPLKSPSVFNFFQPSFSPAGPLADRKLQAPEFELFTESNELGTSNWLGKQVNQRSVSALIDGEQTTSYLDFTYEVGLASDIDVLLSHLDIVLMSGSMSSGLRSVLVSQLQGIPANTQAGLLKRVRDAITVIIASPDYLVQM